MQGPARPVYIALTPSVLLTAPSSSLTEPRIPTDMKLSLQCGLLSALLCLAASLQCYHYRGTPGLALRKQEPKTCEDGTLYCSSSLITYRGLLFGEVLVKVCASGKGEFCNKTESVPLKHIQANQSVLCCASELCNAKLVPDSVEDSQKGIDCLVCNGHPSICGGDDLPSMRCGPSQTHCLQNSITTAMDKAVHHVIIKSCSNTSVSPGLSAFSNGKNPVSYASNFQYCSSTQCNTGVFTDTDPGAENGLVCHNSSSPESVSTMRCRGEMTRCMDLIGVSPMDFVMSGCATESFCRGLYPKFPIPGWKSTACCSSPLCNRGNTTTPSPQ
ncbi:uncharacterized protein LOC142497964 [Ascaphus truei]|uniref:uncharacterized protein LOC142497964 n=1 Tax=Ascaphus truei TaxID=8439 RepID=UPI003F5A9ADE